MTSTPNFGLSRIPVGGQINARGNQYTDQDRLTIDAILHGLESHTHGGRDRLRNPSAPPQVALQAGSGQLSPDTTYYYQIAFVDKWGLETAASAEASVATGAGLVADEAPALTRNIGGTLPSSTYSYVYTWVSSSGGETTSSPVVQVVVSDGDQDRSILLTLPALPEGASEASVYRTRLGLSTYYYIGSTSDGTFVDAGLFDDCCGSSPPTSSTATTSSSILVSPALADQIVEASYWRLYRTTTPGAYSTSALVAEVPSGTVVTDSGQALLAGMPRSFSATVADPALPANPLEGARAITAILSEIKLTTDPVADQWRFDLPFILTPTRMTLTCATLPTSRVGAGVNFILDSTGSGSATLSMADNSGVYTANWPRLEDVQFTMQGWGSAYSDMVDYGSGPVQATVISLADGTWKSLLPANARQEVSVEAGSWTVSALVKGKGSLTFSAAHPNTPLLVVWDGELAAVDVDVYTWVTVGEYVAASGEMLWHQCIVDVDTTLTLAAIKYTAVKPVLQPGLLTLRHGPVGAGTIGDGFCLTVWY